MNNKIIIAIIAVILLGGGIFAWQQFRVAEPVAEPEIVAPQAILRGNKMLTFLLPANIKQGYRAVFDLSYQGELVGEATLARVGENKIQINETANILGVYQLNITATTIHSDDLQPKSTQVSAVGTIRGRSMEMKMNSVVDYNANVINTTIEANGQVFPAVSDILVPNTVTPINARDLYVGWEQGNVRVVEKTSVIVPAGTFEVFVVEMSGTVMGDEDKTTYYITQAGEMIKSSSPISELEFPLVWKLRSYLPR